MPLRVSQEHHMDELSAEAVEAPGAVEEAPVEASATDQSNEATEDRFTDLTAEPGEGEDLTPEWLQERYKQMQGDYTRKTQAAAEAARARQEEADFLEALRNDPETQRAVLDQLSEILAEGDETDEETGDANPLEDRLQQLEQERATERAHALAREISSHIDQLASDAGVELDDEDRNLIFERATGNDKISRDATEAAFKHFQSRQKAAHDKWQKSYLASKQSGTQQVPAGTSATDTPDLSKSDERIRRMAAIMSGG